MTGDEIATLVDALGDGLDFGEYELAIYLAVLERGELPATDLAQHADVPKTRVYDTARDLERRGLVEIREGRPMTVAAVDPAGVFDDLKDSLDDLAEELDDRYVDQGWSTEAVSLVSSRRSIRRHLDAVIEHAEYELSLSVPPDLLDHIEPMLRELVDDGVHVNLLLAPASEAPNPAAFEYDRVASRVRTRRGATTPVVAVADGEISVYATQGALNGDDGKYGVIFNRSMLGFLVYGFYSTMLWTTATEVNERDDTRAFPRQYASIRRCVHELQRESGPFRVSVDGRDVLTGDPAEIEGLVMDTTLDVGQNVASMTLETGDGRVTVGGRVAALEDVEAHRVIVERD